MDSQEKRTMGRIAAYIFCCGSLFLVAYGLFAINYPFVIYGIITAACGITFFIIPWSTLPAKLHLFPPTFGSFLIMLIQYELNRIQNTNTTPVVLWGAFIYVFVGATQKRFISLYFIPAAVGILYVNTINMTIFWERIMHIVAGTFALVLMAETLTWFRHRWKTSLARESDSLAREKARAKSLEFVAESRRMLDTTSNENLNNRLGEIALNITGALAAQAALVDLDGSPHFGNVITTAGEEQSDIENYYYLAQAAIDDHQIAEEGINNSYGDVVISIPFIDEDTSYGAVLLLLSGPNNDDFTRHLSNLWATEVAHSLARRRTVDELRVAAEHDPLTGLLNRRSIDAHLAQLRPGSCIALLDLDRFKLVNDTQGHDVGDQLLRAFSAFLKNSLRATDIVGRLGGEEFLLLLPGPLISAWATVERIREDWAATEPLATFSAGISLYSDGDPHNTVREADQSLYIAKRTGRNRVVSADRREELLAQHFNSHSASPTSSS